MRTGLLLMVAGLAMGGVMVAEGASGPRQRPAGSGRLPVVFGDAGLVVFPHLLCLHALLLLLTLAWLLSFTAWPERRRTRTVQAATAGYVALVAVSLAQALAGRAPFELLAPAALIFWASMAVVFAAFGATLSGLRRTRR